jgi:hypothetical protein
MIKPAEFLRITKGDPPKAPYRLGKIDPVYSTGRPAIVFDGEATASEKQYPYLSSYTPTANDRVLLLKVSGSYIVLGKVI